MRCATDVGPVAAGTNARTVGGAGAPGLRSRGVRDVGDLLARGRDGDIYEYGSGLVLRRARDGRNIEREARAMGYVAEHGYPVPVVHDVRAGGSEIVMERVVGPMMMDVISRRLWTMGRWAGVLADLHDRLHEIPGPQWLPQLPDGGDRLVHLDLHPMNVMITTHGPVVIDWTNAARGEGMTDVALTYVLLRCPEIPAPKVVQLLVGPGRARIANVFARRYRGSDLDNHVAEAAELKMLDPNMRPGEIAACRRLAQRVRRRAEP